MGAEPPVAPPGTRPPQPQPVPNQRPAGGPAPGAVPPPPPPSPAPPDTPAAAQATALGAGATPVNVTFKQITALPVACPSLVSRPTAKNIRALLIELVAVLSGIISHQSVAYVYTGIVKQCEVYALTAEVIWYHFCNAGPL